MALQVSISEYRFALALAPATVSAKSQLRRPTTNGRIAFSHRLLSMGHQYRYRTFADTGIKLFGVGSAAARGIAEQSHRWPRAVHLRPQITLALRRSTGFLEHLNDRLVAKHPFSIKQVIAQQIDDRLQCFADLDPLVAARTGVVFGPKLQFQRINQNSLFNNGIKRDQVTLVQIKQAGHHMPDHPSMKFLALSSQHLAFTEGESICNTNLTDL